MVADGSEKLSCTLRAVLKTLKEKDRLGNVEQIKFLKEKQFAAVETGLTAYLAVAGKPKVAPKLPAKPLDDKTRASLRPHLVTLAAAIDRYEETASRSAAARARKALKAIAATWPTLSYETPRGRIILHNTGPDVEYRPPRPKDAGAD